MKYLIFEKNNGKSQHAYTFSVDDTNKETIYSLHRSEDGIWAEDCRGELCLKVRDDGNGISIEGIKSYKLDYAVQSTLKLMLQCIDIYEKNNGRLIEEYTLLEEKIVATI